MNRSESIKTLVPALLKAQKSMSNATKGSSNPFFKSSYADLNAVREAVIPPLHENGFVVLQPTVEVNCKNYVETMFVHESGEWISSLTEIKNPKGDAQGEGSAISYARRYGLQSLPCIGAVDDDGEKAMSRAQTETKTSPKTNTDETSTKKAAGLPKTVTTVVKVVPEGIITKTVPFSNGHSENGTNKKTVNQTQMLANIVNEDEW